MARIRTNEYVRFYFRLDLKCLIPPNPSDSGETDAQWERSWINGIENELQDLIEKKGFDLTYEAHRCEDATHRVFCVQFVFAALHEVQPAQMVSIKRECGTFRILNRSLKKISRDIENQVRWKLRNCPYIFENFDYLYSTCRSFVYEIYMIGSAEVEYSLSKEDIDDEGGSIRSAIDCFNEMVSDSFEAVNITVLSSKYPQRRPADNIFKYDLVATGHFCFPENAVLGNLAMMYKEMPLIDAIDLGIDCNDQEIIDYIDSTRILAENDLELPRNAILRNITLDFSDYDEDLYDYGDDISHPITHNSQLPAGKARTLDKHGNIA